MGLAGAKNKKKWAKDPNNNAWSRNTDTFGQKIMRSQGWAPGDYLGAKDASHSEYYGAANASHIRAVLKDDNMGLGAKRNQGDECVGLDAFQELLGRLNGKSEESLDEARKKREEAKVNKYLHRKLGTVRFVFAGYLVGDKVQALADELKREKEAEHSKGTAEGKKEKKSKKRKAEAEAEAEDSTASEEKKAKKSKVEDPEDDSKARRREKKERKRRERALKDDSNDSKAESEEGKTDETDEDSSSRKKSKKQKKEKRSKTKDAEEADTSDTLSKKKKKRKSEKHEEANSIESSVTSTPIASGTATPIPHRHLARQRFIAQKRAAVMDQTALNQIFMIKT